jgi:hypothetical protein
MPECYMNLLSKNECYMNLLWKAFVFKLLGFAGILVIVIFLKTYIIRCVR